MNKDDLLKTKNRLLKYVRASQKGVEKEQIIYILEKELTDEEIKKYNALTSLGGNPFSIYKAAEIKRAVLRHFSSYFTEDEYRLYFEKICSANQQKTKKI